jgi:hypothetical protein
MSKDTRGRKSNKSKGIDLKLKRQLLFSESKVQELGWDKIKQIAENAVENYKQ